MVTSDRSTTADDKSSAPPKYLRRPAGFGYTPSVNTAGDWLRLAAKPNWFNRSFVLKESGPGDGSRLLHRRTPHEVGHGLSQLRAHCEVAVGRALRCSTTSPEQTATVSRSACHGRSPTGRLICRQSG